MVLDYLVKPDNDNTFSSFLFLSLPVISASPVIPFRLPCHSLFSSVIPLKKGIQFNALIQNDPKVVVYRQRHTARGGEGEQGGEQDEV